MKKQLLLLVVTVVTGCVMPTPYEQNIEGTVRSGGAPAANVKVRFIHEYPEDTCETPGLEAETDQTGKFSFNQLYTPSKNEKYAVVIHPYRLCISSSGQWKTVWKLKTGPAPKSIVFRCNLEGKGDEACKVAWDGQELR
ncbi:MAG: carboxypeptidase regulatory-like domain-containing protein [Desulfobulbaceae bacterium]|nr:carboxypeptidase regulatory-like domain-containing protein [Desulfobulbaceae bacterium]